MQVVGVRSRTDLARETLQEEAPLPHQLLPGALGDPLLPWVRRWWAARMACHSNVISFELHLSNVCLAVLSSALPFLRPGQRVAGAAAGAAVAAPELATLSYGVKGVRLELEGVVCIVHLRRTHKRELLL